MEQQSNGATETLADGAVRCIVAAQSIWGDLGISASHDDIAKQIINTAIRAINKECHEAMPRVHSKLPSMIMKDIWEWFSTVTWDSKLQSHHFAKRMTPVMRCLDSIIFGENRDEIIIAAASITGSADLVLMWDRVDMWWTQSTPLTDAAAFGAVMSGSLRILEYLERCGWDGRSFLSREGNSRGMLTNALIFGKVEIIEFLHTHAGLTEKELRDIGSVNKATWNLSGNGAKMLDCLSSTFHMTGADVDPDTVMLIQHRIRTDPDLVSAANNAAILKHLQKLFGIVPT